MALEPANEDKKRLIESLASEFGLAFGIAEACLQAAGWDDAGARRIASMNMVGHLLLNIRFAGKNPIPHGGLLSILLDRDSPEPEHFIGLVLDGYEYIEEVSPHLPPHDFIYAILNPQKLPRDEKPWLKVREAVSLCFEHSTIKDLFTLMGMKRTEVSEDGKVVEHDDLKAALANLIKPALDNIYMESTKLEISPNFLNGFQYENLMEHFIEDVAISDEERETVKVATPQEDIFKVYLKGQLIIDPHHGVPVEDLDVGDAIICDVIDPQPVAVQVGKMLGIFRRGVWFPAKGKIVDMEESLGGTKRITIRAGHGIYIIARALNAVRIKVNENELDSIMRRIERQRDETIRSAAGVLPIVLVILGAALALTILLHRG